MISEILLTIGATLFAVDMRLMYSTVKIMGDEPITRVSKIPKPKHLCDVIGYWNQLRPYFKVYQKYSRYILAPLFERKMKKELTEELGISEQTLGVLIRNSGVAVA